MPAIPILPYIKYYTPIWFKGRKPNSFCACHETEYDSCYENLKYGEPLIKVVVTVNRHDGKPWYKNRYYRIECWRTIYPEIIARFTHDEAQKAEEYERFLEERPFVEIVVDRSHIDHTGPRKSKLSDLHPLQREKRKKLILAYNQNNYRLRMSKGVEEAERIIVRMKQQQVEMRDLGGVPKSWTNL